LIESTGEGAKAVGSVLAASPRVDGAAQGRLEVAQHDRLVQAPGFGHCGVAGKLVAGECAAGRQTNAIEPAAITEMRARAMLPHAH